MPAEFEFNALRDELVRLRREVAELKRFAASGVVVEGELGLRTSTGAAVFDGPTGGIPAQILRINQWADIEFSGIMQSIAGVFGAFYMTFPWPILGINPSQYTPLGTFDVGIAGIAYHGVIYAFGTTTPSDGTTLWYWSGSSQVQFTDTTPAVMSPGNALRGQCRVRIAPGY